MRGLGQPLRKAKRLENTKESENSNANEVRSGEIDSSRKLGPEEQGRKDGKGERVGPRTRGGKATTRAAKI